MLGDVTVLDLSLQLPGPYATMLLRSLGARVIKVEPPGGDLARTIDPSMFETLNAGKESIELDLRLGESRAVLNRVVAGCDVLIEGFRPGVVDRLGASYADVALIRPDVIYCSLSGYGQDGPYRSLSGHDLNYLGVGGGASGAAKDAGAIRPGEIGVPMIDLASGTAAALAIVAALRERDRTGRGRYLDVAMVDSAVVWSNLKREPASAGGEAAYGVFDTADRRPLSLAVIEDKFWRGLCDVLGWQEWRDADDFATHASRKTRSSEIVARLAAALAKRPRDEWLAAFADADVPAAPVHEGTEVGDDPQVTARGLFVEGPGRLRAPLPASLVELPSAPAPRLGQHASRILDEFVTEASSSTVEKAV